MKTPDDDKLVIEEIKEEVQKIIAALKLLFTECIEEGINSSHWNNATIVIMYKKEDVTNVTICRLICVLSHICKLLLPKRLTNKIDNERTT